MQLMSVINVRVKGAGDASFSKKTTKVGFPPKPRQTKPFTDQLLHILPHSNEGMQHLRRSTTHAGFNLATIKKLW